MARRMRQGTATSVVATTVRDIMTTPVVTVSPDASRGEIAEVLHEHGITGVPVVDGAGAVVGLVSEYDLLAKPGETARDVMTTAVVTVSEDTDIADVRQLLVGRRIRRVPVLAGGRLVGIVSRSDVVALMVTEWVCEVCGESVRAERAPESCPTCHGGAERFALQEQPPGT